MLTLHLLGGVSLAEDSGPVSGAATQRRRLALLARIAAAPGATLSRDRLIGCFWAEEDRERARHHLADSVFSLRRALGKEIVRSVGDDLALDREALRCDLWSFRHALETGALTEAVTLYRGAFLDGFFVGDAPEFERWVEEERAVVTRQYGEALEKLAEEAEDDGAHERAAGWWRRQAALDPFSSRVALRLMRALAAAGDPAAALRHARIHAALLREELEVEPDARVEAFAAELAAGAVASSSPEPRRDPGAAALSAPGGRAAPPTGVTLSLDSADAAAGSAAAGVGEAVADTSLEAAHPAPGIAAHAPPAAAQPHRGGSPGRFPRRITVFRRAVPLLLPLLALALLVFTAIWATGRRAGGEPVPSEAGASVAANTIAVMPFDYRGSPDHDYLAEGLVTLLSASLNGAGQLRTVVPYAVLSQTAAEEAPRTLPSPEEAGETAIDLGAELFVLGTLVASGERFHLDATLYQHGPEPRALARASVEGAADDVNALVDEVSRQLLLARLPDQVDRLTRLAVRTTSSLPALKAFLRGEEELRASRYPRAAELLGQAVREDPSFALAHLRLSMALAWSFEFPQARRAAEDAVRLAERLHPRDRRLISAWNSFLSGDADTAERLYQNVLAEDAYDVEAWSGLGEVRVHYNPVRGRPADEAIEAFEQVVRLSPAFGEARFHLLEFAARDGREARFDSLIAGVDRSSPQRLSWEAARALAWGDSTLPGPLERELRAAEDVIVGVAAVRTAVNFRDLGAARSLATLLGRPGRPEDWRAAAAIMLAQGHLAQGEWDAAQAQLDLAAGVEPAWALEMRALGALLPDSPASADERRRIGAALEAWNPGELDPGVTFFFAVHADVHALLRLYLRALLSVSLQDDADAAAASEELRRQGGSGTWGELARSLALSVEAHRAHARGDFGRALRLLEEGEIQAPLERVALSPFFARAPDRYLRAEALRALGRPDEALTWYVSLTDGPDLLWWAAAQRRQRELEPTR